MGQYSKKSTLGVKTSDTKDWEQEHFVQKYFGSEENTAATPSY
jgi:hypothetical protein